MREIIRKNEIRKNKEQINEGTEISTSETEIAGDSERLKFDQWLLEFTRGGLG